MMRSILAGMLLLGSSVATAQDTCANGRWVPDIGYGFATCQDCLEFQVINGALVTRFSKEPALYQIRPGGPGAGKLLEADTLVRVDGAAITSAAAATRLMEYRPGDMRLTVRKNGVTRNVTITPERKCVDSQWTPFESGNSFFETLKPLKAFTADSILMGSMLLKGDSMLLNVATEKLLNTVMNLSMAIDSIKMDSMSVMFEPMMQLLGKPLRDSNFTANFNFRGPAQQLWGALVPPSMNSGSLGVGLLCDSCAVDHLNDGRTIWHFYSYPVIADVEVGSLAARLGLKRGDTLRAIDGFDITSRQGGERLGAIGPGKTVDLKWSQNGVTHSAVAKIDAVPAASGRVSYSRQIGNARVEVLGEGAPVTRDARTGELRIVAGGVTVVVKPPE